MFVRANFVDIYLQGMRDRSMRSGMGLAREIKLTDWSIAGNVNLSNRSSEVQIPRDICTRLKRYLYSATCSWIIKRNTLFCVSCIAQVSNNSYSLHSATILTHTIPCSHIFFSETQHCYSRNDVRSQLVPFSVIPRS